MVILLVDDDQLDRALIIHTLKKSKLDVEIKEATTVNQGIALFSKHRFDIILLDYSMPDRDGIEMILEIKSQEQGSNTAIMMMSSLENEKIAVNCIKAGAQDFLPKDEITEKKLRRAILHATTRHDLESKLLATYQQVKNLAETDSLTGLPNRYYFDKSLKLEVKINKRNEHILALLLLDIDNFKLINDNFGHDVGDILLQKVTARINHCLRGNEHFSRLGGDEFAITLSHLINNQQAYIVAQRIIDIMQAPIEIANTPIHCTVSIGIALHPCNAKNSEELFKYADIAMYRSKNQGRNQICFFEDEMQKKFKQRLQVELDLRHAIKKQQFELYYQPVIDPRNESLTGFEALIRWKVDGVMRNPDSFIEIAEETHQISEIGLWVIEEAISTLSKWNLDRKKPLTMAINISAVQLGDFTLVDTIATCLSKYDVPANLIEIELTETALLNTSKISYEILADIAGGGCHLSLDDFGTGYSSISHLRNHPISVLKIDKSLMPSSTQDIKLTSLVRGLVSMASILGLKVIAEGVETKQHADLCKELNIERVQGYFYSKPRTRLDIENTYLLESTLCIK
ncbi:diguanylate cyclase [Colwellia sp. PAMC 20917]|uniref:two-component system response regulator n=1 Tax=Colwellia sp. PAMC 20917 TaxID=1816218 RepID=UPI0008780308|nr:GGDEF domain-containing response regulator [Colwellia sp. PAMC 20917]AOW75818.1 diguanylate cyclase [Colwellia sp. PAMC 20917]